MGGGDVRRLSLINRWRRRIEDRNEMKSAKITVIRARTSTSLDASDDQIAETAGLRNEDQSQRSIVSRRRHRGSIRMAATSDQHWLSSNDNTACNRFVPIDVDRSPTFAYCSASNDTADASIGYLHGASYSTTDQCKCNHELSNPDCYFRATSDSSDSFQRQ